MSSERTIEENGKITGTMLGVEDHGILTAWLYLEFDGSGQGFGGYALDDWDEKKKRRIGCAFGAEFIAEVLRTVGVEKWEDLKGKHVRVRRTNSKIHEVGHIVRNQWFNPKTLAESFR